MKRDFLPNCIPVFSGTSWAQIFAPPSITRAARSLKSDSSVVDRGSSHPPAVCRSLDAKVASTPVAESRVKEMALGAKISVMLGGIITNVRRCRCAAEIVEIGGNAGF